MDESIGEPWHHRRRFPDRCFVEASVIADGYAQVRVRAGSRLEAELKIRTALAYFHLLTYEHEPIGELKEVLMSVEAVSIEEVPTSRSPELRTRRQGNLAAVGAATSR